MAELRRTYGNDQQRLTGEMSKLYGVHTVNPAGSCVPILIQVPIFLGVWQAVDRLVAQNGLSATLLGIDLGVAAWQNGQFSGWPYLILPVLSVLLQLLQAVMALPTIQDPQHNAMRQAMLLLPLVFGYIGLTFNQGAVLYGITGLLFAVVQQYAIGVWGALTTYVPILPERQSIFAPVTAVAEPARAEYRTPRRKLRTELAAASDAATEAATREVTVQMQRSRGDGEQRSCPPSRSEPDR